MSEKTDPPKITETLADLFENLKVVPDPAPETQEADEESDRRDFAERLAIDRGCPAKLAREVANKQPGHRCESTHAFRMTMGWLGIPVRKARRDVLALCGKRGLGKSYAAARRHDFLPRLKHAKFPQVGQCVCCPSRYDNVARYTLRLFERVDCRFVVFWIFRLANLT